MGIFVVNLAATFQDPRHLDMILEFVASGHLWSHIFRWSTGSGGSKGQWVWVQLEGQ
ncbi:hypothetical protein DFJ73DRAFT_786095 [Zopfochytrium polystomum]|nr:hypothetical protein DFJ73DRAFT_786095 [Zopfochytrium polystomum]